MRKDIRRSPVRWLLVGGLLLVSGVHRLSAEDELVRVETLISRSGVHPGETFKIALRVRIQPGWHINGHQLADELLIPTSFTFEEGARFKVLDYFYPPAKSAKFEYSETELSIYEEEIILGAQVEAGSSAPPGTQKLTGTFTCQACDHRSCRPPRGIPFEVSFDIVPGSGETVDIHHEIFDKITFAK